MTRQWLILAAFLAASLLPALDRQAPGSPPLPPSAPSGGVEKGVFTLDRDEDSAIDYKVYYDEKGLVAREELDFNLDGTMDTFYYSKDGLLVRQEIDSDFDGRADIWVYLVDGKYIERYERDMDGDGKPDLVRKFGG